MEKCNDTEFLKLWKLSNWMIIMKIKPIKTKADYEAALKKIEQLWGSSYGSPAGDKLDVLVTLVEVYEKEHYPIPSPERTT